MADEFVVDDGLVDDIEIEPSDHVATSPASVAVATAPGRLVPTSNGPSWWTVGLLIVVALLIGSKLHGCDRSILPDEDRIVIDEKGSFALILQDKSDAGQNALSDGQKAAINSVEVLEWCRANGFELRVQNVGDNLSQVEPIWQTLRSQASSPPSLTASVDGNARTGALPDGVQPTIQALESLK